MLTASYEELSANIAEVSVIGSMLIDDRCVPELMQDLTEDDFADNDCRHMFAAIREIFLERRALDATTVLERLGGSQTAAKKLYAVMDITPTAANCREYARLIKDRRQLAAIQTACMEIVNEGTDLATARELLTNAAGLLVQKQQHKDRGYGELIGELLDRQNDKTPPDHLDWGIAALNDRLPVGAGRFVILGADSSVGKTALALQFALSISRTKRVGFFSYETTLADATDRLIANDADVSLGRLKGKKLTKEETDRVVKAGMRSEQSRLRVLESARYTVADIRAKTIARGFEVIFVDYVQLIPTKRNERYEAVTEISIELHAMAQELGVTVIGLSQVTVPEVDKKGRRRYINKDDLRESRQLKQDADVILLLDLSDPANRDSPRVLQIEKNRDGPLAHLILSFNPSRMRFTYVEPPEDGDAAKARERNAKMDARREAENEQRRRDAEWSAAQGTLFQEVEDGGEDLPF